MAFYGSYLHSLDEKGRVAVPAKFRESLLGGVVTKGPGFSLVMYPPSYWEKLVGERDYSDVADPDYREYLFHFFSSSQQINWDAQGRLLLAPQLRDHAELSRNVVFVGLNQAVEVYSEEHFGALAKRVAPDDWERIRSRAAAVIGQGPVPTPETGLRA
ncbi:MAG TPA: cell division/cell wall cluster transcriptional repressor MraZ [Candidatus Dormibacteraeota bacterium]|nr:cell division/cell wall cluster transcriptional repressor MraZ [Candidatus Dormibacteraeota bacterium]HVD02629.1 cell division/cell wall cluster transcriptional repressor MraZ [Candidatus Dormibacteraeota bacterium]